MNTDDTPLLPHGGYRKLRSYKVAEAVYDATVVSCRRFFERDRRMADQMVQAARSGGRFSSATVSLWRFVPATLLRLARGRASTWRDS